MSPPIFITTPKTIILPYSQRQSGCNSHTEEQTAITGCQFEKNRIFSYNGELTFDAPNRIQIVISTANVTMQFSAKPLFENISVKFSDGNRY